MRKPKAAPVALSVFRAALFQAVATMLLPATFIHNVVHSAETALLNAGVASSQAAPHLPHQLIPSAAQKACITAACPVA